MPPKKTPAPPPAIPTSIEDWKCNHVMVLPSGNVIELRRVGLMDLIYQGGIPDTLTPLAIELATSDKITRGFKEEDLKNQLDIVNIVLKASAVNPRVADRHGEDSLGVDEVEYFDKVQIFNWANGVTTTLRPFRPEQKRTFTAS